MSKRLEQLRFSLLDFKVGLRMLARYPGLTVVGTIAIAVAIAVGAIYFEAVNKWQNPRLPVSDPERVVSIRNWDMKGAGPENRLLYEFTMWRDEVETIETLGAAVSFVRNLATDDDRIEPVQGAEVTAEAFRLMETPPLMGRVLKDEDERAGGPPVAVISHVIWKSRFGSDPGVVGQMVKLGTSDVTIVGVMPEGFGFPMNQRIWTPLRIDPSTVAPRSGPTVTVFGRLAPGKSLEEARAELGAIGARFAADHPATHEHLVPRVTTYAKPLVPAQAAMMVRALLAGAGGVVLMLLAIICTNVATLVFARTATRGWEIAVRNALGASRGRIIFQLFIEGLVLAGVGAVLGMIIAKVALRQALHALEGGSGLPFWIDSSISWKTMLGATLLTLIAAAIIGVLPALRVTRKNVQDAIRREGSARSGLKFGGFWTTVIVAQVAITVAFLPIAAAGAFTANRFSQRAEGIGAEHYLTARLSIEREDHQIDSDTFNAHGRSLYGELARRLRAEPGVEQVAFADRLPVEDQFKYLIEIDNMTAGAPAQSMSTLVHVSEGFFPAFGTTVVAGRDFSPADFENRRVVIVNEGFARHVLGGRNPVGHRVRIVEGEDSRATGEQWYEIVGMVRDFGWQLPQPQEQSAIYRPTLPTPGETVKVAVRVSDPAGFATRLRAIAADVDPRIHLNEVQPLTNIGGGEAQINWTLTSVAGLVAFIVLLLSATGIHSLMSFTVSRRTREIGIRAALGAGPGRIVAQIFSRAFLQIATGVVVGSSLAALAGLQSPSEVMLLLAADAIMLIAGLIACAVPVRRALRIDPTEALREEG